MAVFYKYQYTNKRKNIHPCHLLLLLLHVQVQLVHLVLLSTQASSAFFNPSAQLWYLSCQVVHKNFQLREAWTDQSLQWRRSTWRSWTGLTLLNCWIERSSGFPKRMRISPGMPAPMGITFGCLIPQTKQAGWVEMLPHWLQKMCRQFVRKKRSPEAGLWLHLCSNYGN